MSDTSCGGVSGIPVDHKFLEILEYISLAVLLLSVFTCVHNWILVGV